MIRRRRLLLAAGALLAAPAAARAQTPKLPVVAYVFGGRSSAELQGSDPKHPHARAFVHRLRELGWEDGRNVTLERHGPGNSPERAQEILADLAARNVTVIYAASAVGGMLVAKMAMQATRSIPIVFAGSNDPVAVGLVTNLARPGGNVTGIAIAGGEEIIGKRLELLKQIVPNAKKTVILSATSGNTELVVQQAAAHLKIESIVFAADNSKRLDEALVHMTRGQPEGLVVAGPGFLGTQATRLLAFAAERRLPTVYGWPEAVDAGGLASFGIDFLDLNRRAADYVSRILRGAKPGDLPVELPTKFEVVINLKTARALGLRIPQPVLVRADRVID